MPPSSQYAFILVIDGKQAVTQARQWRYQISRQLDIVNRNASRLGSISQASMRQMRLEGARAMDPLLKDLDEAEDRMKRLGSMKVQPGGTGMPAGAGGLAGGLGGIGEAVGMAAGIGVAGYTAKQAVEAAWDLGVLGARVNDVQNNLEKFAGSAGKAADYTRAVEQAADGTIDRMNAMNTAARMLQMGIADTEAEMALYVEGAVRLGDQTISSGQRVDEMTQLLKNLNVNMLDNFGLSRSVVMARTEELKATEGLTREEGMLQAIQEEISRQLEVLGDRADDGAVSIDQMKTSWTNMKLAIGTGIAPVVISSATAVTARDTHPESRLCTIFDLLRRPSPRRSRCRLRRRPPEPPQSGSFHPCYWMRGGRQGESAGAAGRSWCRLTRVRLRRPNRPERPKSRGPLVRRSLTGCEL